MICYIQNLKKMCHKAWSEMFNCLRIDMTRNRNEGKYRILNESSNTYFECNPEKELFQKRMVLNHTSTLLCVIINL